MGDTYGVCNARGKAEEGAEKRMIVDVLPMKTQGYWRKVLNCPRMVT